MKRRLIPILAFSLLAGCEGRSPTEPGPTPSPTLIVVSRASSTFSGRVLLASPAGILPAAGLRVTVEQFGTSKTVVTADDGGFAFPLEWMPGPIWVSCAGPEGYRSASLGWNLDPGFNFLSITLERRIS